MPLIIKTVDGIDTFVAVCALIKSKRNLSQDSQFRL